MRIATATARSLKAEVNVTPMIDILLVLLIIFMVISPNLSMGLDSQVPHPSADATPRDREETLVLSIGADSSLRINQESIQGELFEIVSARSSNLGRNAPYLFRLPQNSPLRASPRSSMWQKRLEQIA